MTAHPPATRLKKDNANVIFPPPLIALAFLAGGIGLSFYISTNWLDQIPFTWRLATGLGLLLFSLIILLWADKRFAVKKTPVEPWKPVEALVTDGIFDRIRNPMYLGFYTIMLGVALLGAYDMLLPATLVCALVIHWGVIRREEAYLEAKFGDPYRSYKARVPRYGWRLW